ncbi:MAG: hypothetical protein AB7E80_17090 [Hyphomicrobiaceae bacterium]
MLKGRKKELWDKAEAERQRCHEWLRGFMRDGQPKPFSKAELCTIAMRDLRVSKCSFDQAWISAIEESGRHDWYEPLRARRRRTH